MIEDRTVREECRHPDETCPCEIKYIDSADMSRVGARSAVLQTSLQAIPRSLFKVRCDHVDRRLGYSYRSATRGSTRVARRAGTRHATVPTTSSTNNTPTKVRGSRGETPQSWLATQRVSAMLASMPSTMPTPMSRRPLRSTIFRTVLVGAPSAIRMPISWVCNETE